MPNIKFEYLRGDEENYKTFGEIVFSNPNQLSIESIFQNSRSYLIEGTWFDSDPYKSTVLAFITFKPLSRIPIYNMNIIMFRRTMSI